MISSILILVVCLLKLVISKEVFWENCSSFELDIPVIGKTKLNQCTQLSEETDCKLMGKFTLNQQQIFMQEVDLTGKQGPICQSLPGVLSACKACFNLDSKNSTQCASLDISCGSNPIHKQELACFDSSELVKRISKCEESKKVFTVKECLNNCSNHGKCNGGVCFCDSGFYGPTCNISIPSYGECITIPFGDKPQELCAEFIFLDCDVKFNVKLGKDTIYDTQFPLYQFLVSFETPYCFSLFNCSMCIKWDQLHFSHNLTGGCSNILYGCGSDIKSYPLFCFEDTEIVNYCLGRCPNGCSLQGQCIDGKCHCDPLFTGNDCSIKLECPNNCGGADHGRCEQGTCICQPNYQGSDCSIPFDKQKKEKEKGSNENYLWMILIGVILIVLLVILSVAIYFRVRDKKDRKGFTKLQLNEEEDEEDFLSTDH